MSCLILSVALIVVFAFSVYTCHRVNTLSNYIDLLESEMTEHESHTNGAFLGSYSMMKEVERKLLEHCHSYNFEDGVLYIKNPIIDGEVVEPIDDANDENIE